MISFEDAEKALNYLKSTDREFARLKAYYDGLEGQRKTVEAMEYLSYIKNGSKSSAAATQSAKASKVYSDHLNKTNNALMDFETMKNLRATAIIQIDLWRSINSNMKKGNM